MAKGPIALVGADQVGVALALALKRALPDSTLVLVDRDNRRLREAAKIVKYDRSDSNLKSGCRGAVLAILNLPPSQLYEALKLIGPDLVPDSVILDLCGVKEPVYRWAEEVLPAQVHYMGCHLILHPEKAEQLTPNADLFHGAVLCMMPTARTDPGVITIASDLAKALGARPYFLEPAEHDGMVAGVEGLPELLALAVGLTIMQSEAWPELSVLAGATYDQLLRSAIDPALDVGAVLALNGPNVARWLDTLQETLRELRRLLAEGNAAKLEELVDEVAKKRAELLSSKPMMAWVDAAGLPSSNMNYQRPNPLLPHWGVKT